MIRYTLIIGFLLGLVTTTVIYIVQVFIFNHSFDVINCIISFILSMGFGFLYGHDSYAYHKNH